MLCSFGPVTCRHRKEDSDEEEEEGDNGIAGKGGEGVPGGGGSGGGHHGRAEGHSHHRPCVKRIDSENEFGVLGNGDCEMSVEMQEGKARGMAVVRGSSAAAAEGGGGGGGLGARDHSNSEIAPPKTVKMLTYSVDGLDIGVSGGISSTPSTFAPGVGLFGTLAGVPRRIMAAAVSRGPLRWAAVSILSWVCVLGKRAEVALGGMEEDDGNGEGGGGRGRGQEEGAWEVDGDGVDGGGSIVGSRMTSSSSPDERGHRSKRAKVGGGGTVFSS